MTFRLAVIVLAMFALGCSNAAEKESRAKKSDFHYKLAVNSYLDKDVTSALAESYKALELNPDNAQANHLLGFIYMGRQQYSEALKHLEKAVALDPRYFEARANLGALQLAMENWQAAIDVLLPLTQEPLYSTPYIVNHNIGWAYYNLGNLGLAERYTKLALFLNAKMCLAYNTLGLVYEKQRKAEDAIDTLREANRLCPDYQDPFFHLGTLLEKSQRFDEARVVYDKCRKLAPESQMGRRCGRKIQ
jgi:tetratricopeptide (TPR) repeat protein